MSSTIRAFVAIELPISTQDFLESVQEQLKPYRFPIRWVKIGNIHLTLKFLGDIDASDLNDIENALNAAALGHDPLDLLVKGIGVFPGIRRPRILWTGLDDKTSGLSRLQHTVEINLAEIGFPKEARTFRPHLTIGRFKGQVESQGLRNALEAFRRSESPSFAVTDFYLFQSYLKPQGAQYTKRIHIPLGNRLSGSL